jgi:hypothetical protein
MECWNNGMALFGKNLAPLWSTVSILDDWKFFKTVLIIPYKRDKILQLRFTVPVFHYSELVEKEWLSENSLLSTFCRISGTYCHRYGVSLLALGTPFLN